MDSHAQFPFAPRLTDSAAVQFSDVAEKPKRTRKPRASARPVGSDYFDRSVAVELPRCQFTGALRWSRTTYVSERFRLEAERNGERMGMTDAGTIVRSGPPRDSVQGKLLREAMRKPGRAYSEDAMPLVNGLWQLVSMSRDAKHNRLYVQSKCSGPCCSSPTNQARTRKFPANEWMRRQTSCSGCATYRRRTEGEAQKADRESAAQRARYAELKAKNLCHRCKKPLSEFGVIKCLECRVKANSAARKLAREDTRRTPQPEHFVCAPVLQTEVRSNE